MAELIITINAGSSSLKCGIYSFLNDTLKLDVRIDFAGIGTSSKITVKSENDQAVIQHTQIEELQKSAYVDHKTAFSILGTWLSRALQTHRVAVVSHRIVHGGDKFLAPVVVDAGVLVSLKQLIDLAPLHQPIGVLAIEQMQIFYPKALQVACFDTTFHATMAEEAKTFALPTDITKAGVRPYGFHGLSYEYIASHLPTKICNIANNRVVVAHLGQGASMCAMVNGLSVATTMSFTPLDGLPMATRSGAIDASVVIYLHQHMGMSMSAISKLLNEQSGLFGMSGVSRDIQQLTESKVPEAMFAVSFFAYRICRELGSLVAAMGGLDALVFTGGVGTGSASIRAAVCRKSQWLDIHLDEQANKRHDLEISSQKSGISVWTLKTDEAQLLAERGLEQWLLSRQNTQTSIN